MALVSGKSAFYVDFDVLRALMLKEMAVRATTQYQVTKDTGINTASLSNFLNADSANKATGLSSDTFVTLMRWGNFAYGEVVKRRKGFGTRHTDTKDQAELRAITDLLKKAGVELEPGESVSQMLSRVLGSEK